MVADKTNRLIWAYLLHLGYNMWSDRESEWELEHVVAKPYLRCDDTMWKDALSRLSDVGANMVVIDLGEGVIYESHPELAVKGSWSGDRLRQELDTMRSMGLEPIPKMNFSTAHDAWLREYGRMVSSDVYYGVCSDLIKEVSELFGSPRLFHLGMDEETAEHQQHYGYSVMRQHELWWHDLLWMEEEVKNTGARAWVWSDYVWHHPELFYDSMPKSVMQSNWYYAKKFPDDNVGVTAYRELEEHGYDQIPTGSNWSSPDNMAGTVDYAIKHIDRARLKGFLQTPWKPTLEVCREVHTSAIDQLGAARKQYEAAV